MNDEAERLGQRLIASERVLMTLIGTMAYVAGFVALVIAFR